MIMGSPLKDMALSGQSAHHIIPLLEEYCYEKYDTLENILGEQIVDVVAQRIDMSCLMTAKRPSREDSSSIS